MRKKINNKTLLLVFVVLLALVIVLFTNKGSHKERSFNKQLVEFNADEITQVKMFPHSMQGQSYEINRDGDSWTIFSDNKSYKANKGQIDQLVNTLQTLEAKSLVANSKDRWENYEVTDSLASRVQLYKGSKKVADVLIGKFQYSQSRNMSTYVRLNGKKETYKVDGFLSSTYNRKVNDLRDKTIINDPIANWTKLIFDYPADSSFVLTKADQKWMINGVMADSAAVAGFVNGIKNQSAATIYENEVSAMTNIYRLTIERENLEPVVISAREEEGSILFSSSENKDVWFNDKNKLEKYFVSKSKFEIN